MLVEHTLIFVTRCPVNGQCDVYEVTFRLDRLVLVEHLLLAAVDFKSKVIYQEDLTKQLAALFECEVESRGSHSGVRTRVVCPFSSVDRRE